MKKKLSLCSLFVLVINITFAQQNGGTIVRKFFTAPSLLNNKVGESAARKISVYLPPGYDKNQFRYPVIYYLHGYSGNDSLMMNDWIHFKQLMDAAISEGRIRPTIVVTPDSHTSLGGSFYTNSEIAGNWADYIGIDVVQFIDSSFRTIAQKGSRGIAGHSMGGNGALKIAMMFSDVFGMVYALSPAVLNWGGEFTPNAYFFRLTGKAKTEKQLMDSINSFNSFFAAALTSLARAYSSNEKAKTLKADFPVEYIGDSAVYHFNIIKKWEAEFPYNMIESHANQLKSLIAIKLDWGRNDEFAHLPITALAFSKRLEYFGIKHEAEEFLGNHNNMQDGFLGRVYTEVLPFFERNFK